MVPNTEVTEVLQAKLGYGQCNLIERWVSYAVGLNNRDQCLGPLAMRRVLDRLNVELRSDSSLLFDGELRLTEDGKTIFLREGIARSRANFTIAHELGHAALYEIEPSLSQDSRDIERMCNLFAAELLLPAASMRRAMAAGSFARTLAVLAAKSGA